ncbi:hypothetical protein [Nostoc sp.]|uniref:hypothetical protein n=1 Tax=Nostoc sp. TaxID=1180 RepID=UPI002FFCA640
MPHAQYFSTRSCANGLPRLTSTPTPSSVRVASRREAEMLSTSRSVQVPHAL